MFDFAWSEIALIAVVAMIFIGPKDMPVAIRAVTGWIKKARRMAAEFQTHVDEMVREADLSEIRTSINEIRNFDIKGEIERTIDTDGSMRATFAANPFEPGPPAATSVEAMAVSEAPPVAIVEEPIPPPVPAIEAPPCAPAVPAFIPPNLVHPASADETEPEVPAFIPPEIARQHRARPAT